VVARSSTTGAHPNVSGEPTVILLSDAMVRLVGDMTPPPAIETLLALPGAHPDPTGAHRVLVDGIKVEVQGTEPFAEADLDGLTDKQILYVAAHRYALDSATPLTLVAQDADVCATVRVAWP
jgi:hypothetical protein